TLTELEALLSNWHFNLVKDLEREQLVHYQRKRFRQYKKKVEEERGYKLEETTMFHLVGRSESHSNGKSTKQKDEVLQSILGSIVTDGFNQSSAKSRLGPGVYFSNDFSKLKSYASQSDVSYVLEVKMLLGKCIEFEGYGEFLQFSVQKKCFDEFSRDLKPLPDVDSVKCFVMHGTEVVVYDKAAVYPVKVFEVSPEK
ncbi:hypothetical protein DID78_07065, partial [Candidatus Marinamargulisbacteria bacterium SCGC AG-343-D04]